MKYRRKTPYVKAERFIKANSPWPEGVAFDDNIGTFFMWFYGQLGGGIDIKDGDWVVTESDGSRYRYTDEKFNEMYERVK